MQIKEFRPRQRIQLNYSLSQLEAEKFEVGKQGVVSIDVRDDGVVSVVRDDPRGGRQRIVYSAVGAVIYDEPEPVQVLREFSAGVTMPEIHEQDTVTFARQQPPRKGKR